MNIYSLKGIEYFTELKNLYCSTNRLSSLDLRQNTKLVCLSCSYNYSLTSLDISTCTALQFLYCSSTGITSLNLSNCLQLATLDCKMMDNLTSLSVTGKSKLKNIYCNNCTSLVTLNCNNNALTTLNVMGCTALNKLNCYDNPDLEKIVGLADCTAMTYLSCERCSISDLSAVSGMYNLGSLYCHYNKLTSLDVRGKSNLRYLAVSGNTSLTNLSCSSCALTYLGVTGCTSLKELKCYYNYDLDEITGLADCTAITYLDCEDCALTNIDGVQSMTNISTLMCRNNKLVSLVIANKNNLTYLRASGNTSMTLLSCYSNNLTGLNVSGCTALKTLKCYYNYNLTEITGLADCTAITYLDCEDCAITDVSAVNSMNNLEKFYCRNNQISTLTLNNKPNLSYVRISGNPNLTTLRCSNNSQLSTVYMYDCPALESAWINMNNLSSLDLSGCTSLNNLSIWQNHISGNAMTNLVNSLPTVPGNIPGEFAVLDNVNEGNVITDAQVLIAKRKNWVCQRWTGSNWAIIDVPMPGDVDGDGVVNIADVTALIDILLSGGTVPANADVDGDGIVNIADVTALIDMLLSGNAKGLMMASSSGGSGGKDVPIDK